MIINSTDICFITEILQRYNKQVTSNVFRQQTEPFGKGLSSQGVIGSRLRRTLFPDFTFIRQLIASCYFYYFVEKNKLISNNKLPYNPTGHAYAHMLAY